MLNTANEFTTAATGAPPGWRAFDIRVSSRNLLNNPVHTFAVTDRVQQHLGGEFAGSRNHDAPACTTSRCWRSFFRPRSRASCIPAFFANMFKTPQLLA